MDASVSICKEDARVGGFCPNVIFVLDFVIYFRFSFPVNWSRLRNISDDRLMEKKIAAKETFFNN